MTPLEIAQSYLGVKENPPSSNNVIFNTWYYGKPVNGDYPWCVTFQQKIHNEAGVIQPKLGRTKAEGGTASCSELLNWYKKNAPQCVVKDPEPGDLVIFKMGHVGIIESVSGKTLITIEGNTSRTSQNNGGEVMRRGRNINDYPVSGYIRPSLYKTVGGDKSMDIVKGSTSNEKRMVKAIQSAIGAIVDGEIGTQTVSDIACLVGADCFPLTLKIYNAPVIIAEELLPFEPKGASLSAYTNTINGSFYASNKPCSILVTDGRTVSRYACHATFNKPETVLYKLKTGLVGIQLAQSVDELPAGLKWAVGGFGLLDYYDPKGQGFAKITYNGRTEDFSDVIRKTNHTMIGFKNDHFYMVYCENMTAASVNAFAKKLGLKYAIMLDGGHVAGINGSESFAKINTKLSQYYMIQGVKK